MTFQQAIHFNPQTLIDNPALIVAMGATVDGKLVIENDFAFVQINVSIGDSAFILQRVSIDATFSFLDNATAISGLLVTEKFANFFVGTLN